MQYFCATVWIVLTDVEALYGEEMEGLSIVIPVFNKIESTVKCINSIREFNMDCAYEIIVVDNGSTDETQGFFSGSSSPGNRDARGFSDDEKIIYIRNEENLGVSRGFNMGAEAAGYNILCFMHNDVFIFMDNWAAVICDFLVRTANTGVAGLYGAKTLRKDSSFRGKTIVHSMRGRPSFHKHSEKAAVIDGLLMAVRRPVFERIGGYCEDFTFHFYDKDISLRSLKNGFDNYVLNIPFEHACATTRKEIKDDERIRYEDKKRFLEKWSGHLPADVTTWREKIDYFVPFNFPKSL